MLTISKAFIPHSCLLYCLCENTEYPGSFENRLVSSYFKWVPNYILFLAKLEREGRPFWSIDLSSKLSLTCGKNVNYYKSVHHPIPTRRNREHYGNFKNKSVRSLFTRYISFLTKLKKRGRPFLQDARRGRDCEITLKSTWLSLEMKKSSLLWKFEIILPVLFLLDPYDKFVDRFQDLSKVKNPAVSKTMT